MPLSAITRYLHVTYEWYFCSAAWALAVDSPRPKIPDRHCIVRLLWIKVCQTELGLNLHPFAPFTDFLGQTSSVLGYIFEKNLIEQNRNWIDVARNDVRTDTQSF